MREVGRWAVIVVMRYSEECGAIEFIVDGGQALMAVGGLSEPLMILPTLDLLYPYVFAWPTQLQHRIHLLLCCVAPATQHLLLHLFLSLLSSPDEDV